MDPELPQRAATRQPLNPKLVPRAGVDIDALLDDLRATYPEYLEYFVRADAVATDSAGAKKKSSSSSSLDRLHRRVLNATSGAAKSPKRSVERTQTSSSSSTRPATSSSSSTRPSTSSTKPSKSSTKPSSSSTSSSSSSARSSSSRDTGTQPITKAAAKPIATPPTPAKSSERPPCPVDSPASPDPPSVAGDTGEDIEMSSPTTQQDGFEPVTSKSQKRKLKTTKSQADPPVKVFATAKRTSFRSSNPPSSPHLSTSAEGDSEMEAQTAERIPPLFVREKSRWEKLVPMLDQQGIKFSHARSTAIGIRVQCPDSLSHRRLTALLREENIGYHTYALQDERVLRAVIKGLPRELDTGLIKEDLVSQGIPVIEVHRMYRRRTKQPYDMVLVIAELSEQGKRIHDLKSVCRLSGLKVEEPMGRGKKMQCHNCQLYGHGARYCYAQPRCVKCLEGHVTSDCPRKQPTEEPPSCVLCGSQGHPANYRGCPKAPKEHKRKGKTVGGRSVPPPAPKFVPAPPPATNAWSKPLYKTAPTQATASSGSAPPPRTPAGAPAKGSGPAPKQSKGPTPKPNAARSLDSSIFQYLDRVIDTIDLDELEEYIEETKIDPVQALCNHAGLIRAIKALRSNV